MNEPDYEDEWDRLCDEYAKAGFGADISLWYRAIDVCLAALDPSHGLDAVDQYIWSGRLDNFRRHVSEWEARNARAV